MLKSARRTFPLSATQAHASRNELPAKRAASTVRFVDGSRPGVSVLEVFVPSEWDVIGDVHRTLYELRVQVIHASGRYADRGTSLRYQLDVVEFDGATLDKRKQHEVVLALVGNLLDLERETALAPSVVRTRGSRAVEDTHPETSSPAEEVA